MHQRRSDPLPAQRTGQQLHVSAPAATLSHQRLSMPASAFAPPEIDVDRTRFAGATARTCARFGCGRTILIVRWWFTPDVTNWIKTADEVIGLREKLWVVDSLGALWLRKKPLSWRATELAIEAFTLELARRCGYGVAFGRCCTWKTEDGVIRGFVSRKFHDTTEEQSIGGLLLAPKLDLPADLAPDVVEARRRAWSTIELTREVLREQEVRYRVDLVAPFLRMLVFDAWIGNGDRHSANWAILVRGSLHGSGCRLAPMYDTAGCLLADLTDETVERRFGAGMEDAAVQRYVEKCRSGLGTGWQSRASPTEISSSGSEAGRSGRRSPCL